MSEPRASFRPRGPSLTRGTGLPPLLWAHGWSQVFNFTQGRPPAVSAHPGEHSQYPAGAEGPPTWPYWPTLHRALKLRSTLTEDRTLSSFTYAPNENMTTLQSHSSCSRAPNFSYRDFLNMFLSIFLTLLGSSDIPQVTHLHLPAVTTFPLLKIPKPNFQSVLHSKYPRWCFSHGRKGAKKSFLLDD